MIKGRKRRGKRRVKRASKGFTAALAKARAAFTEPTLEAKPAPMFRVEGVEGGGIGPREYLGLRKALESIGKPAEPVDRWAHRSSMMKCRTCIHFVPKSDALGRCRRHAPALGGWPAVFPGDVCGDHKLDEKALG